MGWGGGVACLQSVVSNTFGKHWPAVDLFVKAQRVTTAVRHMPTGAGTSCLDGSSPPQQNTNGDTSTKTDIAALSQSSTHSKQTSG